MSAFTCLAVATKGGIQIADGAARQSLRLWTRQVGEGVVLKLTVEEAKGKRSLRQNRLLWGPVYDQILAHIMLESGYRADEARESLDVSELKQRVHYGLLAVRFGYVTDPVTKQQVPARTSSTLTTAEMAEYFEWLVTYCADELHIQIVLPDELAATKKQRGAA